MYDPPPIDLGFLFELTLLVGGFAISFVLLRQRVNDMERRITQHEGREGEHDRLPLLLSQLASRVERVEAACSAHGSDTDRMADLSSGHAVMAARLATMEGSLSEMRVNQNEMRSYFTTKFDQLFTDVHRIANVVSALAGRAEAIEQPRDDRDDELLDRLRAVIRGSAR